MDSEVVAISEEMETIALYIQQFSKYFRNHREYEIDTVTEAECPKLFDKNIMKYSNLYIHPFSDNIVLTDREITYYTPMFREMYENMKTMLSQCVLNCSILNLTIEEKKMNMDLFDRMYEKIHSYQSFLNSLDKDVIFEKYFISPGLVDKELMETRIDLR